MTHGNSLSRWVSLSLAGAGLVFVVMLPASAADVTKEIAAAEQHAGYAAASKDLKAVHMHLQHVINCLVGPQSKSFDAKAINPCKGLGDGALSDTKDTDVAKNKALELALDRAQAGLKEDELSAAQKAAAEVSAMLKKQM